MRLITASFLILLAAAPAAAQGQAPKSLGGFSARALDERGTPIRSGYFELELDPGERYEGRIAVINGGEEGVRLRSYPADGLTGGTTGTVYANRGDALRETGTWITLARKRMTVAAGARRPIDFTVAVPGDARPGDHVGAVIFEAAGAKSGGQFSVKQVLRVAVAVHVRVSGPAVPQLTLGRLALKPLGGTQIPAAVIPLENRGQLFCRPLLQVALLHDGETVGTVRRQLDTVLPGDTLPYELSWPEPLKAGTYRADVTASGCGDPAKASQDVVLDTGLSGTAQQPGTVTSAEDGGGGVPVWALAVTALVALLGGWLLARRGRRSDEPRRDPV